ncbi:MAG TPA: hypothetical protein VGJ61_01460 [Solirubrobacterales bacterium]
MAGYSGTPVPGKFFSGTDSLIATPHAVIEVERQYPRPRGILWNHLQPPQIREIPILERMGYA